MPPLITKTVTSSYSNIEKEAQHTIKRIKTSRDTNVENQQAVVTLEANQVLKTNTIVQLALSKSETQEKTQEELIQNLDVLSKKDEWNKDEIKQTEDLLAISTKNPKILTRQLLLAKKAIAIDGFFDDSNKSIVTNLLSTSNLDNPSIIYQQFLLANMAIDKDGFFDDTNKSIVTNLLSTPNLGHPAILGQQFLLAQKAFAKDEFFDDSNKSIVTNLLSTSNLGYPAILGQQLLLANMAIAKDGFFDDSNKSIVTNLLTPLKIENSSIPQKQILLAQNILQEQLQLAKMAIDKDGFFDDSNKSIVTNLLSTPNLGHPAILGQQLLLAQKAFAKDEFWNTHDKLFLVNSNKSIFTDLLSTSNLDNPSIIYQKLQLAKMTFSYLNNNVKKTILTNLLNTSNFNNPFMLYQKLKFTQTTFLYLNNNVKKTILTNLLNTSNLDNPAIIYQKLLLAKMAINKDKNFLDGRNKSILTNLLTPQKIENPSIPQEQILLAQNILQEQLQLAKMAIDKDGFWNDSNKQCLKNLLVASDLNEPKFCSFQHKLMKKAIDKGILDKNDSDIKNFINNFLTRISNCSLPFEKNLSLLSDEQLKTFDEREIAQRQDIDENTKLFNLEYLIDLKISRGLYQDNWNSLAKIITDEASILTPQGNTNPHNDGVYNLTVIALKQMPLEKRTEFLNKILKATNNENLQQLLNTDNQCANDKLLEIRPVLRQYNKKQTMYDSIPHEYRMPRTTDRCETFKDENGKTMLGYQGTSQYVETSLTQEQIEYLFGEQRPNGNQHQTGNCWLVAELKHIMYDPQLKLYIMNSFSMDDKGNVSITLKNGKKVTFPKNVVDKASKIVQEDHLPPAMACLSLLAAIQRTKTLPNKLSISLKAFQKDLTITENLLKKEFSKVNFTLIYHISKISANQDPIEYALRVFNKGGNDYRDLLYLFFDNESSVQMQNETSDATKSIRTCIHTLTHAWSIYDDNLAANPQKCNTLFEQTNKVNMSYEKAWRSHDITSTTFITNKDDVYYVPNIDPSTHKFYTD